MLSDLSCDALPFDAGLDFDDLLDIAREFEFTRTITHIWPCDELGTGDDTGLDDILAAIVSTPDTFTPPPSSTPSTTVEPVLAQNVDPKCTTLDATTVSNPPVFLSKEVRAETGPPVTLTLRGWSPPNGSQCLDLDDSVLVPQADKPASTSPWLASFLAAVSAQPVADVTPSSTPVTAISDAQARTTTPQPPFVSTIDTIPRKKNVPAQASVNDPIRARSAAQSNANVQGKTVTASGAKPSKSRPHSHSGSAPVANYAKAPRGGIPPHIARLVTRSNVLRVENERKVMQEAFSNMAPGQTKKPSVLRKATKENVSGGGSGRKSFDRGGNDLEKEGRVAKRARI